MKTAELDTEKLDHAVALARWGAPVGRSFKPHKNWAQGGKIIEETSMNLWRGKNCWYASIEPAASYTNIAEVDVAKGPTALIAAMRCYVASKMGEDIDLPEYFK